MTRCVGAWAATAEDAGNRHALLLVDIYDITLVSFLDNDWDAVRILVADPPRLLLALLCGCKRKQMLGERGGELQAEQHWRLAKRPARMVVHTGCTGPFEVCLHFSAEEVKT